MDCAVRSSSRQPAFLGQPVKIGRARAGVFPRTAIHLGDVRIGDPARVTLAEVDVSTDFRELLSRRIQDAAITIANSRIEMPLPFTIPSGGEGETSANTSGNTPSVVEIVSIRTIALDDIVVVSRGKEVRVSAESSLAGNRLTLTASRHAPERRRSTPKVRSISHQCRGATEGQGEQA
jgi:hypothetical protein